MKDNLSHWLHASTAVARCSIPDNPLAEVDSGAARGERGHVVDVDTIEGYVYVDFGRGAILCHPTEIK